MRNIKQIAVNILLVLVGIGIASSVAYVKFLQMELSRAQGNYAQCEGALTANQDKQADLELKK